MLATFDTSAFADLARFERGGARNTILQKFDPTGDFVRALLNLQLFAVQVFGNFPKRRFILAARLFDAFDFGFAVALVRG